MGTLYYGGNDMMTYLTMMSSRLVELRRVLKPSDSRHVKLLCDAVFELGTLIADAAAKTMQIVETHTL